MKINLILIAGAILSASASQAPASILVATFTGFVKAAPAGGEGGPPPGTPTIDYGSTFGGGVLDGDAFTFRFSFDPAQGQSMFYPNYTINRQNSSGVATLTINNHSYTYTDPAGFGVTNSYIFSPLESVQYDAGGSNYISFYDYKGLIPLDFRTPFSLVKDTGGFGTTGFGQILIHGTDGDVFGYLDPVTLVVAYQLSSVPLPSSAPLFGAALLGLGAIGYGMKRKASAAA